jgi:hypothetical protein
MVGEARPAPVFNIYGGDPMEIARQVERVFRRLASEGDL